MKNFSSWIILTLLIAVPVSAQQSVSSETSANTTDTAELVRRIENLESRIATLDDQNRLLRSELLPNGQIGASPQPTSTPSEEAAGSNPNANGTTASQMPTSAPGSSPPGSFGIARELNLNISAIGDFVADAGHNPVQFSPSMQMNDSEVDIQAMIDRSVRGDFFLLFGEQGVQLDEGYATFTTLPGGLIFRAGKMRSAFGIVNTWHQHELPWVDRPLVTYNLVGGDEGINDAGISLERAFALGRAFSVAATAQLFRGDSGDQESPLFQATTKSDVGVVGNLRLSKDLTAATSLEVGFSYARGHNDQGSGFLTDLYDINTTYRWKPRSAGDHSFVARSELIWSQRQQTPADQHAFGFYVSGDYQLKPHWRVGARFDRSQRSEIANLTDQGASAVLTYYVNKFSQVRGQYRFTQYAGNLDAHELLMQVIFSLGRTGNTRFRDGCPETVAIMDWCGRRQGLVLVSDAGYEDIGAMNWRETGIVLRNLILGGNLDSLVAARHPRKAYYYLAESRFLYKCLFPNGDLPQKNVWEALEAEQVPVVIYGRSARHWFHSVASYATDLVSMCMLCQILKPRMILEIGTFTGSGALHWAGNAPEAQVYTLDLPPNAAPSLATTHMDRDVVRERLAKPMEFDGKPEATRIHCLYGDSATFDFSPYLGKADLVFIDGAHSYEYVRSDTLRAGPCCRTGGVIAWHDYGRVGFNSVSRWLHEFAGQGKVIYRVPGGSLAYTRV